MVVYINRQGSQAIDISRPDGLMSSFSSMFCYVKPHNHDIAPIFY